MILSVLKPLKTLRNYLELFAFDFTCLSAFKILYLMSRAYRHKVIKKTTVLSES